MRALIATTYRRILGGTEAYVAELLPALRARGHDATLT
jgi:hypothetical protein